MINLPSSDLDWHLVIINDPAFLPGKSIFNVIQILLRCYKFRFVILNDIEGSAQNGLISILKKKENTVLKLDDFLTIVCEVKQFDWGDFFLFKEYPKGWNNPPEGGSYPQIIVKTDTTVRAIDDQYIYIYTRHQVIVDAFIKEYKIESIKTSPLNAMEYPY